MELTVDNPNFYLVHGFPGGNYNTRIWDQVELDSASPNPDTTYIVGHMLTVFLTCKIDEDFSIWHGNGLIDIGGYSGMRTSPP